MEQRYTSSEVVKLTGITPRQLQWWDERRIVVAGREGRRRLYSMDDLAEVAVICELRRKGFPLQRVRKIIRFLQKELGKRLVETVSSGSDYHLLTDGKRIYLENSDRQIVDILKNARQPLLSVCLSDAVREIRAETRRRNGGGTKTKNVTDAGRKGARVKGKRGGPEARTSVSVASVRETLKKVGAKARVGIPKKASGRIAQSREWRRRRTS